MWALARELTAEGRHAALHFSCESAEAAGDDFTTAQRLVFFDEIDALRGQSLLSVLRQLRDMFRYRPDSAPWSVALCGLRDVRDYKAASGGDPGRLGSVSPFNVKVESLRLGDFTRDDLVALYTQHTDETGQVFTEETLECAWTATCGQPWLVNALAFEITRRMKIPAAEPITAEHMETAKERLILARSTHLDSLADKLRKDRVRGIIQPRIAGTTIVDTAYNDDVGYVRDFGLIAPGRSVEIANPIYREVIVRVLSESAEPHVAADSKPFV